MEEKNRVIKELKKELKSISNLNVLNENDDEDADDEEEEDEDDDEDSDSDSDSVIIDEANSNDSTPYGTMASSKLNTDLLEENVDGEPAMKKRSVM